LVVLSDEKITEPTLVKSSGALHPRAISVAPVDPKDRPPNISVTPWSRSELVSRSAGMTDEPATSSDMPTFEAMMLSDSTKYSSAAYAMPRNK